MKFISTIKNSLESVREDTTLDDDFLKATPTGPSITYKITIGNAHLVPSITSDYFTKRHDKPHLVSDIFTVYDYASGNKGFISSRRKFFNTCTSLVYQGTEKHNNKFELDRTLFRHIYC